MSSFLKMWFPYFVCVGGVIYCLASLIALRGSYLHEHPLKYEVHMSRVLPEGKEDNVVLVSDSVENTTYQGYYVHKLEIEGAALAFQCEAYKLQKIIELKQYCEECEPKDSKLLY